MNARAFQEWAGRLALVALLMLAVVPSAGRLVHAATDAGRVHIHGLAMQAHAGHVQASPAGGNDEATPRPAPGDADCDYCPLLASLLPVGQVALVPSALPLRFTAAAMPSAPRLPWSHPSGLGSRGPPVSG